METVLLSIDALVPYRGHKCRLYDDSRLAGMAESIAENGLLSPIVVRLIDGGQYEILSGHNRVMAFRQLGFSEVPAVVKTDLPDDVAALIVAESNLIQRSFSDMCFSERAFVIKDYMDALRSFNKRGRKKRQLVDQIKLCQSVDLYQVGTNYRPGWAKNLASDKYALSPMTVHRYERIAQLPEALLTRLDVGELPFISAVELSYMAPEELSHVSALFKKDKGFRLPVQKAKVLRAESKRTEGKMSSDVISDIVTDVPSGFNGFFKLHPQVMEHLFCFDIESVDVINGMIVHYLHLLETGKIENKLGIRQKVPAGGASA